MNHMELGVFLLISGLSFCIGIMIFVAIRHYLIEKEIYSKHKKNFSKKEIYRKVFKLGEVK